MIELSLVDSARRPLSLRGGALTRDQLTAALSVCEVGEKDGEALIPAVFAVCPDTCHNHGRVKRVDCGGGAPHRLGANVVSMTGFAADLDHLRPGDFESLVATWQLQGREFWWWETYSHTPEAPRGRVFFPFAEHCPIQHPRQWSSSGDGRSTGGGQAPLGVWAQLVAHLGLSSVAGMDEACRDPSRLYYTPRKPDDGAIRRSGYCLGKALDWPAVATVPVDQSPSQLITPRSIPEGAVDLDMIRRSLAGLSEPLVQRVLAGKAPTPPPEERKAGDPARYAAWLRITSVVSMRLEGHEPLDAVLAILEPAWVQEAQEDPSEHTPWETVEALMESAMESAPEKKAELNAINEERKARMAETAQRFLARRKAAREAGPKAPSESPDPEGQEEDPAEVERDELENPELRGFATDKRNAERLRDMYGKQIRFATDMGDWFAYNGVYWQQGEAPAWHYAASSVLRMYEEIVRDVDEAGRPPYLRWAEHSESYKGLRDTLGVAKTDPALTVKAGSFDLDLLALNLQNGTLDLRTGDLREHTPSDLLTRVSPIAYDPAATCPTWEAFLSQVLPDTLTGFLQRAVGYSLTGSVAEQVLFFLHGGGSNGKTTFVKVIQELLGDYAKQTAPDLLLAKHQAEHLTEIAALRGARMAVCTEVEEGRRFAESKIKQLTGGDTISARFMHKNHFEFQPTHKFWLSANHQPPIRGQDHAIWRRLIVIPFTRKFDGASDDKSMLTRLRAELPGILNWAIAGCQAWQRDGLGRPAEVTQAVEGYRRDQDVLSDFLEEMTTPGGQVPAAGLYQSYVQWCEDSGEEPRSKKGLASVLKGRDCLPLKGPGGVRLWQGLSLRRRGAMPAPIAAVEPPVRN